MSDTSTRIERHAPAQLRAGGDDLLLRPFGGDKPTAPAWFHDILATPYTDDEVTVDGVRVVWREWGRTKDAPAPDKPVLLFVHGGMAHKSWWDFVAPFFIDRWRPVCLDVPGMGQSGWRETYSLHDAVNAVVGVGEGANAFCGPIKPTLVGHSFGGLIALTTAGTVGERFAQALLVDIPVRPQEPGDDRGARRAGGKLYDSFEDTLARFRLVPAQPCENLFLADHVARHAIKTVPTAEGDKYTWAHDPDLWVNYKRIPEDGPAMAAKAQCPLAHIRAAKSLLVTDERWAWMREHVSGEHPMVTIPLAGHHLMLDQPLALVTAIAGVIEGAGR